MLPILVNPAVRYLSIDASRQPNFVLRNKSARSELGPVLTEMLTYPATTRARMCFNHSGRQWLECRQKGGGLTVADFVGPLRAHLNWYAYDRDLSYSLLKPSNYVAEAPTRETCGLEEWIRICQFSKTGDGVHGVGALNVLIPHKPPSPHPRRLTVH